MPIKKACISRPTLTLIGVLLLGGCVASGPRQAEPVATQEPQTQPAPTVVRVEPVRPEIALTEDLLYRILEAEFAGQRGHLDIAIATYLDLSRVTRDPLIVERATRIAVFARDSEAATESALLWAELDPRNPDPHQVLAVMALRASDIDNATEHLESILDYTHGELDQKLLMIANLLGREGDRDLIMQVMEQLISTRQNSAQALFAFARVATVLGRYDRSLELLNNAIRLDPANDDIALSYVSVLQRLERTAEAISWMEKLMSSRGEQDFNLSLAYARLLTDVRRFEDARKQYETLVSEAPSNPDVLYALGLLYLQSNQLNDAELYFERLSKRPQSSDDANYYLGRIAEDRKQLEQAGIRYQNVQNGRNYFDSQVRLALILARQDRIEAARKHLKTIRTRNDNESVILIQAEADILIEGGRLQEALEVYDAAIGDEYDADLLYARAMLAEKLDRLDILERDLREILVREPGNAQALNALGYTLADRTNRYDEALALIDRALELSPNDYYILDSKGWVLYRLGRLDEAIEYLQRALELRPDGEIAAHLGEVLWVKGNRQEARRVWETALKAMPENTVLQDVIQRFSP